MALFNTDLSTEILLFSVDAIFSIFLIKSYSKLSRYISCLQDVMTKEEAKQLDDVSEGKSKYVVVEGSIKALKEKIPSVYVPSTSGVVQKLTTTELLIRRNSSGFWWDDSRLTHESCNEVPFAIVAGKHLIRVKEALQADVLHLETVYNHFDSSSDSVAGNLWSFFFGVRHCGFQTTEELLKEGTIVTGIGQLLVSSEGSKLLAPPVDGKPYLIITRPISSLLRDLTNKKQMFGLLLMLTGTMTILFGGLLTRRMWLNHKKRRGEQERKRRLDQSRKSRRQKVRDPNVPDTLRCVVCQENPREIIMLPCGHVCVCEDCCGPLKCCPICRGHIEQTAAAFLS